MWDHKMRYGRKLSSSEEAYLQKIRQEASNKSPNTSSNKVAIISSIIAVLAIIGYSVSLDDSTDHANVDITQKDAEIARLTGEIANLQEQLRTKTTSNENTVKVAVGATENNTEHEQGSEKGPLYDVVNVVDGDTIKINIDGKDEVIRMIGINTPETVDPRKPVECFGKEASAKAKELLSGKKIYLEEDVTQGNLDKYNRLLRFVFLEDGTNFGEYMIKEGYANEYTYNTPYKYQNLYKNAEKEAKEQKKGLWADDVCDVPVTTSAVTTETKKEVNTVITPVVPVKKESSGYACNCSKTCPNMSSCAEAQYQLNMCGCSTRDADDDGIACDADCQ